MLRIPQAGGGTRMDWLVEPEEKSKDRQSNFIKLAVWSKSLHSHQTDTEGVLHLASELSKSLTYQQS